MPLHSDPIVDRAMRANIGAGFHFFTNAGFHKSRSVTAYMDAAERYAYVVEHYRSAFMGGHLVQSPHFRVIRVDLKSGETEYLTRSGLVTSEMIEGRYVKNGEQCEYDSGKRAREAAKRFSLGIFLAEGDRVELHPGCDLWVRGARYGVVRRFEKNFVIAVRMEHKHVRTLQRFLIDRLTRITPPMEAR